MITILALIGGVAAGISALLLVITLGERWIDQAGS